MKNTTRQPVKKQNKGNPIPVRFEGTEETILAEIASATGLGKAEIIRRAGRYSFPKFLSREVNILDVVPDREAVPA